jgi:hypothetical protein
MRLWKSSLLAGVTLLFLSNSAPAYFDEYDDSESHPLRIAAYAINPIGYTLKWIVLLPIHALVSQPELEPVFGHTPHQFDFSAQGMPEAELVTTAPPAVVPPPAMSSADAEAARRAADEARAAAEEAKRAAEEAARAADKSSRAFEKSLRK